MNLLRSVPEGGTVLTASAEKKASPVEQALRPATGCRFDPS